MAKTINQIRENVNVKLADESDITAAEHREIETDILDYIQASEGSDNVVKSKVVMLDSFTTDRNYSVNTDLSIPKQITGVIAMLFCKVANNNFVAGDVVTAPTPYPGDSGRTNAQGIGVQYNNSSPSTVKVVVNDQLTIMTAYNSASGAIANNVMLMGGSTANWAIKLIIGYI